MSRVREVYNVMVSFGMLSIFRRYFILGMFDGIITSISVVFGGFLTSTADRELITVGLSGLIGVAVSSGANAFVVEERETTLQLEKLERQMMRSLKSTIYYTSFRASIWISVIVHGLSPLVGLLVIYSYVVMRGFLGLGTSLLLSFIMLIASSFLYGENFSEKMKTSIYITISGIISIMIIFLLVKV